MQDVKGLIKDLVGEFDANSDDKNDHTSEINAKSDDGNDDSSETKQGLLTVLVFIT